MYTDNEQQTKGQFSMSPIKFPSSTSFGGVAIFMVLIWLGLVGGVSVISSFPSSYAFDFIASQFAGCAVRLENPVVRTGLGALGAGASGAGFILAGGSKALELTVPAMADKFHADRCVK